MTLRIITTIATASALSLVAVPTIASEPGQSLSISTSGIDLGSAEGQRTLDRRIDKAARKYCGADTNRTGTRIRSSQAQECVREIVAKAKRQLAVKTENARRGS